MGDYRLGLGMRTAAISAFLVVVVMNALLLTQAWPF
jgi:hypothetical protein